MNNEDSLKLQLVLDVINLPEEKLTVVRDFLVNLMAGNASNGKARLSATRAKRKKKTEAVEKQSATSSLLALVGCVSYYPPQKSIDEELYGDNPL